MQKTIAIEEGSDYYDGERGRIHYRFWKAEEPSWVVLLAHGFGDHTGRWERYGRTLAEAGGAVLASDHRGHGLACRRQEPTQRRCHVHEMGHESRT